MNGGGGWHISLALSHGVWCSRKRPRIALKNVAKAGSLLFGSKGSAAFK